MKRTRNRKIKKRRKGFFNPSRAYIEKSIEYFLNHGGQINRIGQVTSGPTGLATLQEIDWFFNEDDYSHSLFLEKI